MKQVLCPCILAFGLGLTAPASAATWVYQLGDHDFAGAAATNDYCLRLDEYNRFFSCSAPVADVTLTYDDVALTAVVDGKIRANFGNGSFGGIWDITYTATNVTDQTNGAFIDMAGLASGTLTNGTITFDLFTKDMNGDYGLALNDGHRLPGDSTTPVYRSWLDDADWTGFNDFISVLTLISSSNDKPDENVPDENVAPMPIPASLPLLAAGLYLLYRRKRA